MMLLMIEAVRPPPSRHTLIPCSLRADIHIKSAKVAASLGELRSARKQSQLAPPEVASGPILLAQHTIRVMVKWLKNAGISVSIPQNLWS